MRPAFGRPKLSRTMSSDEASRTRVGYRSLAAELLAPIYGRFTEGFGTADLRAAKTLLSTFG